MASLSYIPQVRKAWPAGSTHDLSLGMLAAVMVGLSVWVAYGLLRHDWIIVCANMIGAGLAAIVLACKIRDLRRPQRLAPRSAVAPLPIPAPRIARDWRRANPSDGTHGGRKIRRLVSEGGLSLLAAQF